MTDENEDKAVEIMPLSAVESMIKGEIATQIATAHEYPRSLQKFKTRAIEMATIDEETAESCLYRRPVGKGPDGQMKFAEGMSIRMAEIVGSSFGNLRVYATLVEQTDRRVMTRGMAMDLEANFASSSDVIESTVDSKGRPYSERMNMVVAKAALAKARRDATFQVVPKALCRPVEAAVRELLLGSTKSLEKRREAVIGWVDSLQDNTPSGKLDPKRVWRALGVAGPADLTSEHLETLTGIRTALKDNEITLYEAFPAQTWQEAYDKATDPSEGGQVVSYKRKLILLLDKATADANTRKNMLKELTGKIFITNITEEEAKEAIEKLHSKGVSVNE